MEPADNKDQLYMHNLITHKCNHTAPISPCLTRFSPNPFVHNPPSTSGSRCLSVRRWHLTCEKPHGASSRGPGLGSPASPQPWGPREESAACNVEGAVGKTKPLERDMLCHTNLCFYSCLRPRTCHKQLANIRKGKAPFPLRSLS